MSTHLELRVEDLSIGQNHIAQLLPHLQPLKAGVNVNLNEIWRGLKKG